MLLIFATLLFVSILLHCAGYTLFRAIGYTPCNPLLGFWSGLFVISFTGILASLFFPLAPVVAALCFFSCVPGILPAWRHATALAQQAGTTQCLCFFVLLLAVACALAWLGAYASWQDWAYDTDLYHMQSVRWLKEQGTPLGLGNLHSRLAHTSSWLVLAALLDHGPLTGRTPWLMPALLLGNFAAYSLYGLCRARTLWQQGYLLCFLPLFFLYAGQGLKPNLYYDAASLLLYYIVLYEILCLMLHEKITQHIKSLQILLVLVALSFMIKPVTAPSIIFASIFSVYILYLQKTLTIKNIAIIFSIPACAAGLYIVKNYILSGYPIFPLALLPLHADWTMPQAAVQGNADAVMGWARLPGEQYLDAVNSGIRFWIGPWLSRNMAHTSFWSYIMAPLLAGCVFWVAFFLHKKEKWAAFFCAWTVCGMLYWFCVSPDPRFGREFFWTFLACGMAFFASSYENLLKKFRRSLQLRLHILCVSLGTGLLCIGLAHAFVAHGAPRALFAPGTQPSRAMLHTPQTSDNFYLYIPATSGDDRCGNAPLPCAPSVPTGVCLRKPGQIGAGFKPCL